MNSMHCPVCKSKSFQSYQGPIRKGKFGTFVDGEVLQCFYCELRFLNPNCIENSEIYEGSDYRVLVGEEGAIEDYFNRHDSEQLHKIGFLDGFNFRNKRIVDVGSGGGSFLDLFKGLALETAAVEPMSLYHRSLRERGHLVYKNLIDACAVRQSAFDFLFCHSVIEHIEKPLEFLSNCARLLKNDGVLVLSTPNYNDILNTKEYPFYQSFFYRTVHPICFNMKSLCNIVEVSGLRLLNTLYFHRFGFGNFLSWILEKKPLGNKVSSLGAGFDPVWRAYLCEKGLSDYLYVFGVKK